MASFQSFVSEAYLKSFTPISQNIDVSEITPHLEITELIWTREILGKNLYDDLRTKFIAQTLSADEITLIALVKNHISYRAAAEAIPFLSTKIRNKGVMELNGDNEQPASLKKVQWLQDELKNKAEYFETRVIDYLCLHSGKFPLYNSADTESGIITNTQAYDAGIAFDDFNYLRTTKYLYGPNSNNI